MFWFARVCSSYTFVASLCIPSTQPFACGILCCILVSYHFHDIVACILNRHYHLPAQSRPPLSIADCGLHSITLMTQLKESNV